jgi:hypothetical protein
MHVEAKELVIAVIGCQEALLAFKGVSTYFSSRNTNDWSMPGTVSSS